MRVSVPCFNPKCKNNITMTEGQKEALLISFALKYDASVLPTCSKECAEELLQRLSEAFDIITKIRVTSGTPIQRYRSAKRKTYNKKLK